MTLKFKYFISLLGFLIPTLIITPIVWMFEAPGVLTIIGFTTLIIGVILSYYMGIRGVLKDSSD